MNTPALQIIDAKKIYPNGFQALHGVSFHVEPGEFFGLLGPNGAGKSTLISAASGITRLSSGHILVNEFDVVKQSNRSRHCLGVVPQETLFDPFFTVREALRFQSGYFGIRRNDDWVDEILHHLNLADKANTNSRNLSGGMKRRLMVAQALVHRPSVIVLDEPTAGVDIELRQSLWQFIAKLNQQGHTIILTTHYLEEAQSLCNRIALMKQGRLVALDKTYKLLQSEQTIKLSLKVEGELPAELLPLCLKQKGNQYVLSLASHHEVSDILCCLKTYGTLVKQLHIIENNLEDVFLRLTGDFAEKPQQQKVGS